MSARGRGRGRGGVFKDRGRDVTELEAFDGPPQKYPPLENPAIPSTQTDIDIQLITIQKNMAAWMKNTPFYLENIVTEKKLERYSDRYLPTPVAKRPLSSYLVDIENFPDELQGKKKEQKVSGSVKDMLLKTIDEAAAKAGKVKEGEEEEQPVVPEEDYDEENEEEGNDYIDAYFDNGEGEEDEGDDEGAVY